MEKGVKNEYNNKAVEYKWLKKEISVEKSAEKFPVVVEKKNMTHLKNTRKFPSQLNTFGDVDIRYWLNGTTDLQIRSTTGMTRVNQKKTTNSTRRCFTVSTFHTSPCTSDTGAKGLYLNTTKWLKCEQNPTLI